MNVIDLFVCLVLLVAVWNGWRRGFILQICSLVAIVAAVWLAAHLGPTAVGLLHIRTEYAAVVGFVAVFIVALLLLSLLARIVRRIFQFAGFGLLDRVLGVVVAVVKYLLVLSVLFKALDRLNVDHLLLPAETIASSRTWSPVCGVSERLLPFVDEACGAVAKHAGEQTDETP